VLFKKNTILIGHQWIGQRIEAIFKNRSYKYYCYLVILAPGVAAFRAPEKTHLTFICSPELAEPPDCKIVLALRALDLDGGHGLFLSLFLNNYNLILAAVDLARHLVSSFYFPDISAFPALQLTGR
jgi:hypothetical protein